MPRDTTIAELEETVAAILEKLKDPDARIVRPVGPAPGATEERYEIFHDVLAKAVKDWRAAHPRARGREEVTRGAHVEGPREAALRRTVPPAAADRLRRETASHAGRA